jgi:hypothetical protein
MKPRREPYWPALKAGGKHCMEGGLCPNCVPRPPAGRLCPDCAPDYEIPSGTMSTTRPANSLPKRAVFLVVSVGLASPSDSKSAGGNPVRVRISPRASSTLTALSDSQAVELTRQNLRRYTSLQPQRSPLFRAWVETCVQNPQPLASYSELACVSPSRVNRPYRSVPCRSSSATSSRYSVTAL